MARAPVDPNKPKAPRKPPTAKAAYFILQILDENGEPMQFPKARLRVVSVERSADQVLAKTESGDWPFALFLRGMLPAGRGTATNG